MLSYYSSISQANLILDNLGGQSSSLSGLFFLRMCTISNKKEPGQSKHLQTSGTVTKTRGEMVSSCPAHPQLQSQKQ